MSAQPINLSALPTYSEAAGPGVLFESDESMLGFCARRWPTDNANMERCLREKVDARLGYQLGVLGFTLGLGTGFILWRLRK
jgi:hypothetical protein